MGWQAIYWIPKKYPITLIQFYSCSPSIERCHAAGHRTDERFGTWNLGDYSQYCLHVPRYRQDLVEVGMYGQLAAYLLLVTILLWKFWNSIKMEFISTSSSPWKMYQKAHTPLSHQTYLSIFWGYVGQKECMLVVEDGIFDGIYIRRKLVLFRWNIEKFHAQEICKRCMLGTYSPRVRIIEPWPPPPTAVADSIYLRPHYT